MLSTPVRQAKLSLTYNSTDVSADVEPFLLSFDHNDVMDGKYVDDITLTLEDKDQLWRFDWFPELGATLTAKLTCTDWPGGAVLDCGTFEIDDVSFTGPPSTCTIGAVSIGISAALRREKHTQGWEDVSCREVAGEIADRHGFELVFDSDVNPVLDRLDQREQTDMELLGQICDNAGLGLQIADNKILVYEQKKYDARPVDITFKYSGSERERYNFRLPTTEVYRACEVTYLDPLENVLLSYLYEPPESEWSGKRPASGYVLKVNDRCACQEEAERLARAKLREVNKREITGSLQQIGNPAIKAGMVAGLSGFGRLDDGRYLIERVGSRWDKAGGYTTTPQLRGTLAY